MNKLKCKIQNKSLTLYLLGLAVLYFVNDADAIFDFAGILLIQFNQHFKYKKKE